MDIHGINFSYLVCLPTTTSIGSNLAVTLIIMPLRKIDYHQKKYSDLKELRHLKPSFWQRAEFSRRLLRPKFVEQNPCQIELFIVFNLLN